MNTLKLPSIVNLKVDIKWAMSGEAYAECPVTTKELLGMLEQLVLIVEEQGADILKLRELND